MTAPSIDANTEMADGPDRPGFEDVSDDGHISQKCIDAAELERPESDEQAEEDGTQAA